MNLFQPHRDSYTPTETRMHAADDCDLAPSVSVSISLSLSPSLSSFLLCPQFAVLWIMDSQTHKICANQQQTADAVTGSMH